MFSIERYFGICYPIQSRVRGGRRLLIYLVPVILFRYVPGYLSSSSGMYLG